MPLVRLAPFLLLPLLLSACDTVGGMFGGGSEGPALQCPRILPVVEAQEMTRFDGSGRDLTDVVFRAKLVDVTAECEPDEEEIELTLQVVVSANRGPANAGGNATFGYFVAVATREEQVLNRQEYQVTIPFQGNRTNVGLLEEVDVTIPLAEGQTGREYLIYVGLALNEAELEWNRRDR
jgi:hypothetical protein